MGRGRRRNLLLAGGATAAVVLAGYDLWVWLSSFLSDNFHNDFTFYFAAARLGLDHGWVHLYDLKLQQAELDAIHSNITVAQLARFVSPPPLAWTVIPFTLLPYQAAYWAWSALLVAAMVLAWWIAAPGRGRIRLVFLAAAIGWLPVVYGLQLGQPALLVAAGVAVSCALLWRRQDWAAGAVLAVLVLKPQLALLVPAALLVAGRQRAFAAAAIAIGVVAVASVIALGPGGVAAYEGILNFATTVPQNQSQTLAAWLPSLPAARAVQALVALWTLALAHRLRDRAPQTVIAIALIGGLAASPYVHYDDLTMLGLAMLLFMRGPCPRGTYAYAAALFIAAEGVPVWGAGPVLVGELLALGLLSVAALEHRDGVAEHHESEGEHDPDLERDGDDVPADRQGELIDHGRGPA
jgi:alpha-1,2-mannosyltransferase